MPTSYPLPKDSDLAKVMQLCMDLRDKPKEGQQGVDALVADFSEKNGCKLESDSGNCEQSSNYSLTTKSGVKLKLDIRVQGDYFSYDNPIRIFANAAYPSGQVSCPAPASTGFYLLDIVNAPPAEITKITGRSLDDYLSKNNGFKCELRTIEGETAFYEIMEFEAETKAGKQCYKADCFVRVEPVRDSTGHEVHVKLELEIRVPGRKTDGIDTICKKREEKHHYMPEA